MSNNLQILSATSFSPATCWRGSLASLLATRVARNKNKNMQNKANLKNSQMNTSAYNKRGYDVFYGFCCPKNKAKRTQNEPNFSSKLGSFFTKLALFPPIFSIFLYLFAERKYSYRLFKQIKKQSIFHKLREVRENGL